MNKFKNWYIAIVTGLLTLSIVFIIFNYIFYKKNIDKIIKTNEIYLTELKEQIKDREEKLKVIKTIVKTEVITKEILKTIPDNSKDDIILKQQEIIDQDTKTIFELQGLLTNTNNKLKNIHYPVWGIELQGIINIDKTLDMDTIISLNFKKYFLNGKLFISGGAGVKVYKDVGGSVNIGVGVNF